MKYPNAQAGAKKMFTGEILQLISVIALLIGVFAVILGGDAFVLFGALLSIAALIALLVGEVLVLIGLGRASKDEPQYLKKAFIASIAMIIVSAVSSAILSAMNVDESSIAYSVLGGLDELVNVLVLSFSIQGFSLLADDLGDTSVSTLGSKLIWALCGAIILGFVASLFTSTVGEIATVISSLLTLFVDIAYLVFLSRAKKVLEQ